jgi:hypothetical protein|tara:strand:+ start:1307 stop:1537 length:231 start_codon:yes stop_codon:yes gene_type:complete
MAFSKSFPKTSKTSNYPQWEEITLTGEEEKGDKKMPRPHEIPPHERHGYERPPHEEVLERLDKVEETLRRIEDKLR